MLLSSSVISSFTQPPKNLILKLSAKENTRRILILVELMFLALVLQFFLQEYLKTAFRFMKTLG